MRIAAITCVINGATVAASICCSGPLARDQGLVAELTRRRLCLQNIFLLLLLKMEIIQRGGSRQRVWKSMVFLKDGVPLIKVIIIIFLLSLLYQNKMPLFLYQEGSRSFTTSLIFQGTETWVQKQLLASFRVASSNADPAAEAPLAAQHCLLMVRVPR